MASTSKNALDGLLYIRNGNFTARWNLPAAVGSSISAPAGIGNAATITYSFLTATPPYSSESDFLAFTAAQVQATRLVLSSIKEVANVNFVEITGVGQMTFGQSGQAAGQGGFAYTPSYSYRYSGSTILSVTEHSNSGDIWINRYASWDSGDWKPGKDGYATLLHEIGHALGLKHPFEASSNGYFLEASLDDESHTVMSYQTAPDSTLLEVTGSSTSYAWQEYALSPSTLMPLDIEALQYLYGANLATRKGNDTYRWALNPEILETIWDGGGTDTIDCSNQTLKCVINLTAGSYSSISLRQTDAEKRLGLSLPNWFQEPLPSDIYNGSNNLAIAKGVTIEHAKGGSAADKILGNAISNALKGGAGNDSMLGYSGNDTLDGGTGNDSLSGGDGNDSLIGGAGKDTLVGGNGNDRFDFNALSELGTTSASWDVISGFVRGQDKIDLSTLDANTATTINDAFNGTLIASTARFTAAGQLKLASSVLYGNTDSDSYAEFAIQLTGITALSAADLIR